MKSLREDDRPADLWYWNDWFGCAEVRLCGLAARGLWFDMLGIMSRAERKGFLSINGKPMNSKELAKFVGEFQGKVEELLEELEYYKVFSRDTDGTIYNRRMARESDLSRKRAEAGRLGGFSKQTPSKRLAKVSSKRLAKGGLDRNSSPSSSIKEKDFDTWWSAYPRKVAKKDAARAYAAAVKAGALPGDLLRAVTGYCAELKRNQTEERFCKYPATFLREDRWRDYLDAQPKVEVGANHTKDHSDAYWAEVRRLKNLGLEGQALTDAMAGFKDDGARRD